jgi:hypothetical protein
VELKKNGDMATSRYSRSAAFFGAATSAKDGPVHTTPDASASVSAQSYIPAGVHAAMKSSRFPS